MPTIRPAYWFEIRPDTEVLCPDGQWRTGQSLPPGLDPFALPPVAIREPTIGEAIVLLLTTFPGLEIIG